MHAIFAANLPQCADSTALCCTHTAGTAASDAIILANMEHLMLAVVYEMHAFSKRKRFSFKGGKRKCKLPSLVTNIVDSLGVKRFRKETFLKQSIAAHC